MDELTADRSPDSLTHLRGDIKHRVVKLCLSLVPVELRGKDCGGLVVAGSGPGDTRRVHGKHDHIQPQVAHVDLEVLLL